MTRVRAIESVEHAQGAWLNTLGANWPAAVCSELARSKHVVRVVIAGAKGSSPRESGACMLLTAHGTRGTIGGGYLEYESLQTARELLANNSFISARIRHFVLGRELGQCCGGTVDVWFECYARADLPWLRIASAAAYPQSEAVLISSLQGNAVTHRIVRAARLDSHRSFIKSGARTQLIDADGVELLERLGSPAAPLWLYGCGHVGQALVRVLADLPFSVTWIDSRRELLPNVVPANVQALYMQDVVASVNDAPSAAHYLIMTHDHALDYALCKIILARDDFAFAGLIGSKSKSARFRSRLRHDGFTEEQIARLTCPIGFAAIDSKLPAAIAVNVAAQLLARAYPPESGRPSADLSSAQSCSSADCASCPSTQRSMR